MTIRDWIEQPSTRLDTTAGFVDGILNALTLASGKLLASAETPTANFALRVGAATAATTLFVFFVAHYAERRSELAHAEKELSLLSHGQLARGALGRRALRDAFAAALLAAGCGLAGAMVPLLLCFLVPAPRWLGVALTIALLGILGAVLARSFHGDAKSWALALILGGVALTWLGLQLQIAG
jgi:predicted membrane protein (TIGR00267 family)